MYTLPQITQPEDSDFRDHERTVQRLGLSTWPSPLQHGVKYPCHFLSKHPEDPGHIMFLLDNMDCNFRIGSLLLGFTQKEEKGPDKEISCLFYMPEDSLAGFSTLLSLYSLFPGFMKNDSCHRSGLLVPTTGMVTDLFLDAGSAAPRVAFSVNVGAWHRHPPPTPEETEASRSHMASFSGPSLPEAPQSAPRVGSGAAHKALSASPPPGVEESLLPFWLSSSQKTPRLLTFARLQLPFWEGCHRLCGAKDFSGLPHPCSQRLACWGWALATSIHWTPGTMAPTSSGPFWG